MGKFRSGHRRLRSREVADGTRSSVTSSGAPTWEWTKVLTAPRPYGHGPPARKAAEPPLRGPGFLPVTTDGKVAMQDVSTEPGVGSGTSGSADVATDETDGLIASDKVEGTAVYNREGERLGTVYNFMVDKVSGQVAYAVMSFGGFLGLGESYHPLPWSLLTYNTKLGGYVVDLDKDRLQDAPSYAGEGPAWDRTYGKSIDKYYESRWSTPVDGRRPG